MARAPAVTLEQAMDVFRRRFHDLSAERDAILAKSAPLRAKLDDSDNLTPAQERVLRAQILEVEAGLYEIDVERADMVRKVKPSDGHARMGKAS